MEGEGHVCSGAGEDHTPGFGKNIHVNLVKICRTGFSQEAALLFNALYFSGYASNYVASVGNSKLQKMTIILDSAIQK